MRCLLLSALLLLSVCMRVALATPSLVVDLDTRAVLHGEDAGHPWYPASTTKLMTALVTFEALRSGEVALSTPVVMSQKAMGQQSLRAGLKTGSAMTLRDALYAVLVSSANEVAVALAETVAGSQDAFADRMNAAAARLGLTATRFVNPNGLFDPAQQASARDLAVLAMEIYQRYPQYHPIFETFFVDIDGRKLESRNDLLTRFPGTLGMKTGFVCSSGRNYVGLAQRNGRRIVVVILGATTDLERSERAAKLLSDAFDGQFPDTGVTVDNLQNALNVKPEDMRARLCSPQGAAYEAQQRKRFPMGQPGNKSYLTASIAPKGYTIRTWFVPQPEFVPVPNRKPVRVTARASAAAPTSALLSVAPLPKPRPQSQ